MEQSATPTLAAIGQGVSASGQRPLKNMHTDLDTGFNILLEFAIEIPEQIIYWNQLSALAYRGFYSKKEINAKITILNQYYNSALSVLGHLYQLRNNDSRSLQKMTTFLNSFLVLDHSVRNLESMKLSDKLNHLPILIKKIKLKYFKPSYLRRNWVSILLISTVGSWAIIKFYKNRHFIYLAFKELQSTGSQLLKVWIWEPIIRIYETIR